LIKKIQNKPTKRQTKPNPFLSLQLTISPLSLEFKKKTLIKPSIDSIFIVVQNPKEVFDS